MNNQNSIDNRRHFTRIAFSANAQIFTGEQTIDVKVIDISLKGTLIELPSNCLWQAVMGNYCEIVIDLDGHAKIYMHAKVAYVREQTHAGLLCEHIDIESIEHLRRLVELNIADPALLNRELQALSISGASLPDEK